MNTWNGCKACFYTDPEEQLIGSFPGHSQNADLRTPDRAANSWQMNLYGDLYSQWEILL